MHSPFLCRSRFKKLRTDGSHAQRLEQFYGPQAHACGWDEHGSGGCLYAASMMGVPCPVSGNPCELIHPTPANEHADDAFRSKFLWGREPLVAACAARLKANSDMVWVDLGGGTAVSWELGINFLGIRYMATPATQSILV